HSRESDAESESEGEDAGEVDAHGLSRLRILRYRAHGQALTVPAEESEERGEEYGGDHEHEHALIAHARGPDLEDPAHEGRHLAIVAAADGEEGGLHEGGEPESQHEIERGGWRPARAAVWQGERWGSEVRTH